MCQSGCCTSKYSTDGKKVVQTFLGGMTLQARHALHGLGLNGIKVCEKIKSDGRKSYLSQCSNEALFNPTNSKSNHHQHVPQKKFVGKIFTIFYCSLLLLTAITPQEE
jgi:hypothetical protein